MLALEYADNWLTGRWIPNGYNPAPSVNVPGNAMNDIFGQALTVGMKVKLVGTITALDPLSTHFQDVTFTPDYPQNANIQNTQGVNPQQQYIATVKCHPLQLIKVGSTL